MSRESAFRRCESAARQLLFFNRVIEPSEIITKIDNVNKSTVKNVAESIIKTPISVASIGPIKHLEYLDKIQNRIN